jgi:hypothetical protein
MRSLIFFLPPFTLQAQILVDTFAGGMIPTGVPAQNVLLQSIGGIAWDNAGNLALCDLTNNVIRRVRADGIIETIGGQPAEVLHAGTPFLPNGVLQINAQIPANLQPGDVPVTVTVGVVPSTQDVTVSIR